MARRLETSDLRKEYPGTVALDGVSIAFEGGKVHALLGKNGAGKSTLVKMLSGAVRPSGGSILLDGRPVDLGSPGDAFARGIATVHQELSLVGGLSAGENILLGRLPKKRLLGSWIVDWPSAFRLAQSVLDGMGAGLDARSRVSDLGVAQRQVVEIAKAMSFDPAVLILDEPTSALALHETENLFRLLRELASKGVAIVYITHRLQELPRIADTVTVLRDGRLAGSISMAEAGPREIVRMMFGEVEEPARPSGPSPGTRTVLEVRSLGSRGRFHGVSFSVRAGEILGLAGMQGSGRTELLRAVFGADPFDEGEIAVGGRALRRASPDRMKALGIAFTPEDRKEHGLVLGLSVRENLSLASLDRLCVGGVVSPSRERSLVSSLSERLAIRMPDAESPVSNLSGGNQQKVAVGKWLNTRPRLFLFDEPTRGIDLQAKRQIFEILRGLSRDGVACLFVSSELSELLEVCHRILIMRHGALAGEVRPEEIGADELTVRCMEP
jgi:ribose transport system ATP-binding protein